MKILLFGKHGQVGWELQRSLLPLGEVIALDRQSEHLCGNLGDFAGLRDTVHKIKPDVIVNAAAYTDVDGAEGDPGVAHAVNALAPGVLAEAAAVVGAWLVHYSTDYVFNGSGNRPWAEDDAVDPLNVYGRTKLEGERRIAMACARHFILRSSWIYGRHGRSFPKTMLGLAAKQIDLSVVDDQMGAPTGADLLADITAHILRAALPGKTLGLAGTYHVAASGETSRHGYACLVLEQAAKTGLILRASAASVAAIPTASSFTAACRPLNSRLNTAKLRSSFGLHLPAWQQGVARMLAESSELSL